jgi:hypothetical protein
LRRFLIFGACLLALAAPASSQVPQSRQGSNVQREGVTPRGDPTSTFPLPVFEFHSGFWINLHHVLYEQARLRTGRPTHRPPGGRHAGVPQGMTPAEQADWEAALEMYAAVLAPRDLLFDGDMVLIKNRLAELESCPDLSGRETRECTAGMRLDVTQALERAAPVYRARQWPAQDRQNREWIAGVAPMVQEWGARLAVQLSLMFHTDWPATRIRVDVTGFAGQLGGYTSLDPMHIVLSSADERNQRAGAMQALFHEASHMLAVYARERIAEECRARSKPIPRELWSALLFYSTAELLRRPQDALARQLPGNAAQALSSKGWQQFRNKLEAYWKPYLGQLVRGNSDPDDQERAIARLVEAL